MSDHYTHAILKYLSGRDYQPLTQRQLARQLGVSHDEYGSFRSAVKRLRDTGRVVLGAREALTLPGLPKRLVGFFHQNVRGFGFVTPETPTAHGDLFIPADQTGGAMTGDRVLVRVSFRGIRDRQKSYSGEVIRIVQRGQNRFVGTLQESEDTWFVIPDGKQFIQPIVVRDISAAGPPAGTKVVAEITEYGDAGRLPVGVIVETLGDRGQLAVETQAVIRAHGLEDRFSRKATAEARAAVKAFDPDAPHNREDVTGQTVITIDPPDARDYDDAISLTPGPPGQVTLGVHIADVSHFVPAGSVLDEEASRRGTSVYFPKKVVPMLPEILSNGICSLQEGQKRFAKSAFITYDAAARVIRTRLAETVISSAQRLTYQEAQGILDGATGGYDREVVALLRSLGDLARRIEARRREAGMLHLDLPEIDLILNKKNRVVDAVPADDAYTHTMIEMFMVEANEAVARTLAGKDRQFLRRIHPPPDGQSSHQLASFLGAAGLRISHDLQRQEIQRLLETVRGRPESYAVNLAVLKTFQTAEYSPQDVGHYALASDCYCHFTSPIRRYPDLTVHRLVGALCRGHLDSLPPDDLPALAALGERLTAAEQTAEAAEQELREVLILQFLETRIGEEFDGVITGVTNFGIFVQSPRFLIEGVVRMENLGDDWWEVNARYGFIRGDRTGKTFRIGQTVRVRIAGVDVPQRQLHLLPVHRPNPRKKATKARDKKKKLKTKKDKGKKKRRRSSRR